MVAVFTVSEAVGVTINFKPAVNYPVGTNPVGVAAGDFDGDGNIDLAVVNNGNASIGDDGSVSILLGNGDGTFRAAVNISAGKNPVAIAVADFNGDGRPDLTVINNDGGTGNVGILLGNGNGTFRSPVDYATSAGPNTVSVADFNGDLKPDLVVENATSFSVLLGNGDGTFQTHADTSPGGADIVVADFNGDGKLDLAELSSLSVWIFLGNGDGTFQTATGYHSGSLLLHFRAIAPGDFNGDGRLDLFVDVSDMQSNQCSGAQLLGNGDGTFKLVRNEVPLSGYGSISAADFDGDGKLDLVLQPGTSGNQQPEVSLFQGKGDGTFQAGVTFAVGSNPGGIASVDLDGNKSPDIVVANSGDNSISVLLNTIGTDLSISASVPSPSSLSPGQSATSTISLSLLNAFDNPVSLTCSVQPAQASAPTCSLNPNSVTFDGTGKASADLTMTAGPASATLVAPAGRPDAPPWYLVGLPIASLALAGASFRSSNSNNRVVLRSFLTLFLLGGLILESACGGNSPKSQTYMVTVTATSGVSRHSTSVTVTVQ